jgi:hypothetical protein
MRKFIGGIVFVALLVSVPALAQAQRRAAARPAPRSQRVVFALQADWGSDTDFGIGARAIFGLQSLFPKTPLDAHVSFDYFFPSGGAGVDVKYWEINGNVGYRIPNMRGTLAPYVGGGLNIAHASVSSGGLTASDTKAGLNLLAGTTFGRAASKMKPFLEGRVTLSGGEQFVLTGGIRF